MIKLFVITSMYSVFIPLLMGLMQLKRTNSYLIILLILVSFSGLADFLAHVNYAWIPTLHAGFSIIQIVTLFLIYLLQTKSILNKKIILSLFLFLMAYVLAYYVFVNEINTTLPNIQTTSTFIFIALSLLLLHEIYSDALHDNLFLYPLFWITIAILTYFAGNLFLFIANNIFTMEKMYVLYFPIHNVLNATKNVLFAVAFFVQYKSTKQPKTA